MAEHDDDWWFDEIDDEDDFDAGDECGRWDNGRLGRHCRLAGTEFCDFECPYRDTPRRSNLTERAKQGHPTDA